MFEVYKNAYNTTDKNKIDFINYFAIIDKIYTSAILYYI